MKTAIVTGANGFVGAALCKKMVEKGVSVIAIVRNDSSDISRLSDVSILIPTHERPHYFSLALASVISQTYPNIEIVISDNSMESDTEIIVNDFREKYTNIKYFHTPGLDMWGNWQKCWDNMSDIQAGMLE